MTDRLVETRSELLEKALRLAVESHTGQRGRDGLPYILHPLRVMLDAGNDDHLTMAEKLDRMLVGVLHDLIEDCEGIDDSFLLQQGFPAEIVDAVVALTREDSDETQEHYSAFVCRSLRNPLARDVKMADLRDNMDLRRLPAFGHKDADRLRRYSEAWQILSELRKRESSGTGEDA